MTPLERACRAAHGEHNDDPAERAKSSDPAWDGWKSWIPVVRAVLQAIREPSDEMVEAAYRREGVGPDAVDVPYSLTPDDMWPAMIDAALEEG
jgi:hypothetical protein